MHKSLILAVLLMPCFSSALTDKEKKLAYTLHVEAVFLRISELNAQLSIAPVMSIMVGKEFTDSLRKEMLAVKEELELLLEEAEELEKQGLL